MPATDLDRDALIFLRTHGHSPAAERALAAYSKLGEHAAGWIVLGLGGALLDLPQRGRWLRATRTVVLAYVANQTVKFTVRRRRPELPGLPPLTPTVSQLSFPSAHTTTAFAAAQAFRDLVPAPALYGAAGLLAVSRPYLGVHYPSDVLAGAALGTAIGGLACR